MKRKPSLRKSPLILALIAGVLLPLSGRAAGPPIRVAVGDSAQNAQRPVWLPDSLDATYQYDDGMADSWVVPLLDTGDDQPEAIFLEQFEVVPGHNVIDSISVAWGSEVGSDAAELDGKPVLIGIWSDPDRDGQPYDAVLLGSVRGVVAAANTDTFVTYTLDEPVTLPSGGVTTFFLGYKTPAVRHGIANHQGGHTFAGVDEEFPSAGKGWIIWNKPNPKVRVKRLGQNTAISPEDDAVAGNLMIRSGF